MGGLNRIPRNGVTAKVGLAVDGGNLRKIAGPASGVIYPQVSGDQVGA